MEANGELETLPGRYFPHFEVMILQRGVLDVPTVFCLLVRVFRSFAYLATQ
jgi:hypothetical protein